MRSWQTASLIFFVYAAATAYAMQDLSALRRRKALASAALGIALLALTGLLRSRAVLTTWVLPPALLLVGYWTTGSLFVAPMPAAERTLMEFDRRLHVVRVAAAMPRIAAELLELAYLFVYPLIPIALALHVLFVERPDPNRFWMVVLTTDYLCFAMLPWLQTRPPRALERAEPWRAALRRVNRRLLDRASIHVNTIPSGHAAEAVAAALLLAAAPIPIALATALVAIAICAGAVFGRYHYAADVLAGAAVGATVWLCA